MCMRLVVEGEPIGKLHAVSREGMQIGVQETTPCILTNFAPSTDPQDVRP